MLKDLCEIPNPNGRYSTWIVLFSSKEKLNIDAIENIFVNNFDKYKISRYKDQNAESYLVGCIAYIGTRKRSSSIENIIQNNFVGYSNSTCNCNVFKSANSYEKTNFDDAEYIASSESSLYEYKGKDVRMLDNEKNRYPWQKDLLKIIYNDVTEEFFPGDDRSIYWIFDQNGCVGKSKFVKWLCINRPQEVAKIPFGSSTQLRSALISCRAKMCYFIDIPRTVGLDDQLNNLITVLEDMKNGHIVSPMYGKYSDLLMDPPHVIVFSNQKCPRELMSDDRWKSFEIRKKDLKLIKLN